MGDGLSFTRLALNPSSFPSPTSSPTVIALNKEVADGQEIFSELGLVSTIYIRCMVNHDLRPMEGAEGFDEFKSVPAKLFAVGNYNL